MTLRLTKTAALLAGALITISGCADHDRGEATKSEAAPATIESDPQRLDVDGKADKDPTSELAAEGERTTMQRQLIKTAELHVRVSSYAAARTEIDKNLAAMGGFIADAQVEHSDGNVSHADLTIRIPSAQLVPFLTGTAGHGDVTHETVRSQDITEGYYDMKARLRNAVRMETRLLSLLDTKADTVTSLLQVERELGRARGQIEGFEGKLRLWDGQVSLATVKLRLVTQQVYAVSEPPGLMDRIESSLGQSFAALTSFGMGLLIMLAALIPWAIPLTVAGFAVRGLFRRLSRRRAAGHPARKTSADPRRTPSAEAASEAFM